MSKDLHNILRLLKPHIKKLIQMVVLLTFSSLASFLYPIISKIVMDEGFLKNNFSVILYSETVIVLIALANSAAGICRQRITLSIKNNIIKDLYKRVFEKILAIRITFLEEHNNAELINQAEVDISTIAELIDESLCGILIDFFTIVGGFIGLLIISYKLTILILIYIPVKYLAVRFLSKRNEALTEEYIESKNKFVQCFEDIISGMQEIRIFSLFAEKEKQYSEAMENILNKEKKIMVTGFVNNSIENILTQVLSAGIYVLGAKMVFHMDITIGGIFAFVTYTTYVINPLGLIINVKYVMSGILPSVHRFYDFLEYKEEENLSVGMAVDLSSFDSIVFDNVSFGYKPDKQILKNISFQINKKEKIAIVGSNGSGKTTLIRILLRLIEPNNGNILLNGIDIREYDLSAYRKLFSISFQNSHIFNDTLKNNIVLNSGISKERYEQILQDINMKEYCNNETLKETVGCKGAKLSGGQRQKVALGRLFAQGDKILIVDEATANVDKVTRERFHSLLFNELEDITVISITHNNDILPFFDKVIYLKNGAVECAGKHEQLCQNSKSYSEFIRGGLQNIK